MRSQLNLTAFCVVFLAGCAHVVHGQPQHVVQSRKRVPAHGPRNIKKANLSPIPVNIPAYDDVDAILHPDRPVDSKDSKLSESAQRAKETGQTVEKEKASLLPDVLFKLDKGRQASQALKKSRQAPHNKDGLHIRWWTSRMTIHGGGKPNDMMTVFVHVHKSAGSTFCRLAKKQPKGKVHMDFYQWNYNCNAVHEDPREGWDEPNLVSCAALDNLRDQTDFLMIETMLHQGGRECENVQYLTSIRPPLERIISHLAFEHIPLSVSVAIVKGERTPHPKDFFTQVANFDNFFIRTYLGRDVYFLPSGAINETHLEAAKAVLEKFKMVVPIQRIDKALLPILTQELNWTWDGHDFKTDPQLMHMRVNVDKWGDHGSSSVEMLAQNHKDAVDLFREHNVWDQKLFEWADERFTEKYGQQVPAPPSPISPPPVQPTAPPECSGSGC